MHLINTVNAKHAEQIFFFPSPLLKVVHNPAWSKDLPVTEMKNTPIL